MQTKIDRALSKTLREARQTSNLPLDPEARYVIFSDHHRGARTGADDFQICESTYLSALVYYDEKSYTLVVLGDVEELWEEDAGEILAAYPAVFEKEARFYQENRYLRVYGNHDDFWHYPPNVEAHLDPVFPGIKPVDGMVMTYDPEEGAGGELLLVHGNQGVFDLGLISEISRIAVRWFWRTFQILTGKGRTTPAEDACLLPARKA
jgi:UDP-2,3-diacylglucosamine pyrophosphatase LpxH